MRRGHGTSPWARAFVACRIAEVVSEMFLRRRREMNAAAVEALVVDAELALDEAMRCPACRARTFLLD